MRIYESFIIQASVVRTGKIIVFVVQSISMKVLPVKLESFCHFFELQSAADDWFVGKSRNCFFDYVDWNFGHEIGQAPEDLDGVTTSGLTWTLQELSSHCSQRHSLPSCNLETWASEMKISWWKAFSCQIIFHFTL